MVNSLMVVGKKLFLKLDITVFVLRLVLVLDDAGYLFEAVPHIDPFNSREVSSCDGPGSIHHFL